MWKLIFFAFVYICLIISCQGDVTKNSQTQNVAATSSAGSSSSGDSSQSSSSSSSSSNTTSEVDEMSYNDPKTGKVTETKTKNVTTVQESKADSTASSTGGNSTSSANATSVVTQTDIDRTTVTKEGPSNDTGCNLDEHNDNYDCSSALPKATASILKLTAQFLRYMISTNTSQPIVSSPTSTWYLFCFIGTYATNNTLNQLLNFSGLSDKNELRCIMKLIQSKFNAARKYQDYFYYSSNIVADYDLYFTDIFKKDALDYVGGRVVSAAFSDPQSTAKTMNKIISSNTKNKVMNSITKDIAPIMFNKMTSKVVFAAGTYYKAVWKKAFNMNNITIDDYYPDSCSTIKAKYVYQTDVYKYMSSSKFNAQIVQVPLKYKNAVCVLLLPNSLCGMQSMLESIISNPQTLEEELANSEDTCMNLYLPLYSNVTATFDYVPFLKSIGEIDSLFDLQTSQLIDSCGRTLNRTVTYSNQKTVVINTLNGGEPYNASEELCSCSEEPVNFAAKSPLIYLIMQDGIVVEASVGKVVEA